MNVFVRVAETRSFTAAAQGLGLPRATVSEAVQQLEARVGTRLLQRTTRRVALTRDGALFYERARDLLADAEDVDGLFRQSDQALSGTVRVNLSTRLARKVVIPALPHFLERHPGIQLEVGSTDRYVDLIREGYDCVIRTGALTESGLVARRLGEMQLLNVASRGYIEQHGRPRSLKDLSRHWLIHWASTLGQRPDGWEYAEDGAWKTLPMQGRVTVNTAEAYLAACRAGLGFIQVPGAQLAADLRSGRLVEVLTRHRAQPLPVSLLYPHRRHLARRVRVFMDWLEALVTEPGRM